jgi:hypothetical protein
MFIASVDRVKIIFAGSYSGLCYHTDGPSHTSINDASIMSGLGIVVLDPVTSSHTRRLIEWSLNASVTSSVYFRLRRTPLPETAVFDVFQPALDEHFSPGSPVIITPLALRSGMSPRNSFCATDPSTNRCQIDYSECSKEAGCISAAGVAGVHANPRICGDEQHGCGDDVSSRVCFIVMGTVGLFLALECVKHSKYFENANVSVISALNISLSASDLQAWKNILSSHSTLICIEDDLGALYRHVCLMCVQHLSTPPPRVLSKRIARAGPSCRTFRDCLHFHGFTVPAVESLYLSASAAEQ